MQGNASSCATNPMSDIKSVKPCRRDNSCNEYLLAALPPCPIRQSTGLAEVASLTLVPL